MDEEVVQQIVDEVFSSLEPLDTQGAALTEFLKAKGIATDEELAPFLKRAGTTSSVRWLAARVRVKSLIASAIKDEEKKPVEMKAVEDRSEDETERKSAETEKAAEAQMTDGKNKSGDGKAEEETAPENESGAKADGTSEDKQADRPAIMDKRNETAQPDEDVTKKIA